MPTKKVYTPTKSFNLYGGEITVDFYEKYGRFKHIYINRLTGEWLTSVTGATGVLDKPALIPWATKMMAQNLEEFLKGGGAIGQYEIQKAKNIWRQERDTAGEKGTAIHELANQYIEYKLGKIKKMPNVPKDDEIVNGYLAFRDWEKENKVKFISSEQIVYSKKYAFVGTYDLYANVNGQKTLIDFKTGSGIYGEAVYQTNGYKIAFEEETGIEVDQIQIIRFDKKTGEFFIKTIMPNASLTKGFLACLYLKKIGKEVESLVK